MAFIIIGIIVVAFIVVALRWNQEPRGDDQAVAYAQALLHEQDNFDEARRELREAKEAALSKLRAQAGRTD